LTKYNIILNTLKAMIDINNYEEYAMDYLEGKLKGKQLQAMEAFLATQPKLREDLTQMQVYYVEPENNVTFVYKNSLFRNKTRSFPLWRSLGAAAAIALLVFWWHAQEQPLLDSPLPNSGLAEHEMPTEATPTTVETPQAPKIAEVQKAAPNRPKKAAPKHKSTAVVETTSPSVIVATQAAPTHETQAAQPIETIEKQINTLTPNKMAIAEELPNTIEILSDSEQPKLPRELPRIEPVRTMPPTTTTVALAFDSPLPEFEISKEVAFAPKQLLPENSNGLRLKLSKIKEALTPEVLASSQPPLAAH
jgi:hypothetical protein